MKLLAVSDKVIPQLYNEAVRTYYPDVDMVIGCGDLPYYYLEFLHSALDARAYYVRGNHDRHPQFTSDGRTLDRVMGGVDLHGRVTNVNGLILAGLEGSMRYRPKSSCMYTEAEMRREALKLFPSLFFNRVRYGRALDILVTHSPPKDIHDRDDLPHTGFKIFLALLRQFQPRLMLHGHIHLNNQQKQRTRYVNTEIVNVYPYQIFEWPLPEELSPR